MSRTANPLARKHHRIINKLPKNSQFSKCLWYSLFSNDFSPSKALYENHLVELPLASFFLSKLLGQANVNVDLDHLSFLDHELYKNLLYLKTYEGDVADLGLDFTIVTEEVGQTKVEELKPGGRDITVSEENKIEYIHLVADYKLNRQIRTQCNAFR